MVYVISKDNKPLMPTNRHGKVRRLLKDNKAIVVKRTPFTIQLLYETTTYTQQLDLGQDTGSKIIGLSVANDKQEYYSSEIELRNDITNLISTKREFRKARRNRTTRYRKPRFQNRVSSKNKGWLAPSIENKINTHIRIIDNTMEILPISKIRIEIAPFDIQKIQNPEIEGIEYQQGPQFNFWNVREYVLYRDNHICQCCKGKTKDNRLNVHHIESRKTGGDAPNNLITLCETCHNDYHLGKIKLPKNIKRGMKFKDAAFMNIMKKTLYKRLKEKYPNIPIEITFGYETKSLRIENNLPKEHRVDALCITGHPKAKRSEVYYYQKKNRCHNRQIHKAKILKSGVKKNNQAPYIVQGFRLNDKVFYKGIECFITGRRTSGYFALKTLDGTFIHKSAKYSDLKLLGKAKTISIEKRNNSLEETIKEKESRETIPQQL